MPTRSKPLLLAAAALLVAPLALAKPNPPGTSRSASTAVDTIADDLDAGPWTDAADKIAAVLADPSQKASHPQAWALLGSALHKGGLPYAALTAQVQALKLDPTAPVDKSAAALAVSRFNEGAWAGGPLAANLGGGITPELRGDLAVLGARYHFAASDWGPATALLSLVSPDHPRSVEADVLRGVTLAQQGRHAEAIVPLLTARERARAEDRSPRYINTVTLNVARTFFTMGAFDRAVETYDLVERSDPAWPTAHYERAWAQFRGGDLGGALASTLTHRTPFFQNWYFPEAELLRAQSLFYLCKFPETQRTMDAFEARYSPLRDAVAAAVADMSADDALEDARKLRAGEPTTLPTPVLRRFTWDARLEDTLAAAEQAQAELSRLSGDAPGASLAHQILSDRIQARLRAEGERVLSLVQDARADLDEMLADLALTRVDLLALESRMLQRAAAGEDMQLGDPIGRLRALKAPGRRVWPYQGEHWADELGHYRVDARAECPANLLDR